jgi:hypothetical protein
VQVQDDLRSLIVNHAIAEFGRSGLVVAKQGSGTFVADRREPIEVELTPTDGPVEYDCCLYETRWLSCVSVHDNPVQPTLRTVAPAGARTAEPVGVATTD